MSDSWYNKVLKVLLRAMIYTILFIIVIAIGSIYFMEMPRLNYSARANITEAILNSLQFRNCLSQKKDKKIIDDKCTYKESDQYRVDFSDTNNVVIHFNFKAKNYDTYLTKLVKGSIKLSVNNLTNPPAIKCKNISLKNKFLPRVCSNNG